MSEDDRNILCQKESFPLVLCAKAVHKNKSRVSLKIYAVFKSVSEGDYIIHLPDRFLY